MNMTEDLYPQAVHQSGLPATIDGLRDFILVGREKLKAHQAKVRAIQAVDIAESARRAALSDAQDVAEAVIYAEARLGELLGGIERKPKSDGSLRGTFGGSETSLPPGIDKRMSHQAQTLASHPEEVERIVADARERDEIPTPDKTYKIIKHPHVAYNSGENEWYTPPDYIQAARLVMGDIDLDPASSPIANEIVRAKQFYSKTDDGLSKEWAGRVWMNPPYAAELIRKFIAKYYDCVANKTITEGIVLVNNATETQWFFQIVECSSAVVFTRGRVRFLDPQGNPGGAPLQGQAILYSGEHHTRFLGEFSQFGWGARL